MLVGQDRRDESAEGVNRGKIKLLMILMGFQNSFHGEVRKVLNMATLLIWRPEKVIAQPDVNLLQSLRKHAYSNI